MGIKKLKREESDMWSSLPFDLLSSILDHLSVLDRLRCLRLVCKSWRSADIPYHPTKHHPPLLFLPNDDPHNLGKLFTAADQKPQRIRLPQSTANLRFHSSSNGWLAYTDSFVSLHLINPLTSTHLPLPPITAFSDIMHQIYVPQGCFYKKLVVFAHPLTSSMITFVVYGLDGCLAFIRPGDKTWTDVHLPGSDQNFQDIVHHKGQLYAVSYGGKVVTIDISTTPVTVSYYRSLLDFPSRGHRSLVESLDRTDLLQVHEDVALTCSQRSTGIYFQVLRLDSSSNKWVRVERLEGAAVFLGKNECVSISVKDFPELKENCVYFTDADYDANHMVFRNRHVHHTGVYNVKDNTSEPFFRCNLPCGSPTQSLPSWFAPNHVF